MANNKEKREPHLVPSIDVEMPWLKNPSASKSIRCHSIRSNDEPHLQCLLKCRGDQIYCPLHLVQKTNVLYKPSDKNYEMVCMYETNSEGMKSWDSDLDSNPIIRKIKICSHNTNVINQTTN